MEFLFEWMKFNHIFAFFLIENTYFWLESNYVYVLVGGGATNVMTLFFLMTMMMKIISYCFSHVFLYRKSAKYFPPDNSHYFR